MTTLSWTVVVVVMIGMYRMGYSYHLCDDNDYYDVSITRTMVIAILDQYSPTMFLKKADGGDSEQNDNDDLYDVNHFPPRWSLSFCEWHPHCLPPPPPHGRNSPSPRGRRHEATAWWSDRTKTPIWVVRKRRKLPSMALVDVVNDEW